MMEIIKKFFLEDWKSKLFSLFFAFIIWLLISLGNWTISEVKIIVPVNFRDLPYNITVLSASSSNVEVSLKVPKRLEEEIKKANPELNLSLSEYKSGQVVVPLRGEDIFNIPKGVEISKIEPSSIVLNLDKLVEKFVSVEPVIQGKVEGDKIDFSPKRVRVLCPFTLTSVLKTIPTEPVDIPHLKKVREILVTLLVPDPRIIVLDPKYVKISLEPEKENIQNKL